MSVDGDFYRFVDGVLSPVLETHSEQLSVADSFLVVDGFARGLDLHELRFATSVSKFRQTDPDLEKFFVAVRNLIPKTGAWFPRIEFREDCEGGCFFLRMRPAPPLSAELTLWTSPDPDPRANPLIKGPDLSLCQQLRRAANLHGADEAVIVDKDGFIADGALSSIVWWRGDTLMGPDERTNWLPSITRQIVYALAEQAGYKTSAERVRPKDLVGCEVWSLSALQGIRGVTEWQGIGVAKPQRHVTFRKRLSLMATAIG